MIGTYAQEERAVATSPERSRTLPASRRMEMARFLATRPSSVVDLASLAERFGVSEQTIRRDLERLEREGLVRRTFGGAIVQDPVQRQEPSFHEREHLQATSKRAIAELALERLREGEGVFFDGSSTVLHLVRLVPTEWSGDAATSGLVTLNELARRQEVRLTALGGVYEHTSGCVRGAATRRQLETLRFDTAFISARAVHLTLGLCEANADEAELKRTLLTTTARVIGLVDSSKLGATAAHHYADLSRIDELITDGRADPRTIEALAEQVDVTVAPVAPHAEP